MKSIIYSKLYWVLFCVYMALIPWGITQLHNWEVFIAQEVELFGSILFALGFIVPLIYIGLRIYNFL